MAYAEITTRDPNPVKRWLQRRRLADAVAIVKRAQSRDRLRVLDFGAGDGELIRQIADAPSIEAWAYEPAPSLMDEARKKLAGLEGVVLTENLDFVASGTFDYVFCLEVFEHLPEKETADAIAQIHRLLKPEGTAVIGVPHELFAPAMFKGLFRMFRRFGEFDARPGHIMRAALGRPPLRRPSGEISPGLAYHPHHLGFDYRVLRDVLQTRFRLEKKWFSPFPLLGAALNSEVYFMLRKAESAIAVNSPEAAGR